MAGKLELTLMGYQVLSGENDCVHVRCVDLRSSPVRTSMAVVRAESIFNNRYSCTRMTTDLIHCCSQLSGCHIAVW